MSLFQHLAELRYRLVVSVIAIVAAMIVCAFFSRQLQDLLFLPFLRAQAALHASAPNVHPEVVTMGVTSPAVLALKVVGLAGLIVASPVWLWQVWGFIAPALHRHEKKWALAFVGAATPLFLAGLTLGYLMVPKAIEVMLQFTPTAVPVTNLLDAPYFLSFLVRVMLVCGIAFLLPVVVVALNVAGIVTAAQLGKVRKYVLFGCFVFAAVATPAGDPFSMIALAVPMFLLYLAAEVVCRVRERGRRPGPATSLDAC